MEITTTNGAPVLSENAMFSTPTVQRFNNKRNSSRATAQLQAHFKTTGNKTVSGQEYLFDIAHPAWKAITKAETVLRKIHATYTFALPSSGEGQSRGPRLLPNKVAPLYLGMMHDAIDVFDQAVNAYALNYDAHIDASEQRLNGLFDRRNYPDVEEFIARHHASVSLTGLPTVEGIQAGEFTDAYREAEVERQQEAVNECTKQIVGRVLDHVKRLADGLDRIDQPRSKFSDVLFGNLVELTDTIIPACNVANDPALDQLAVDVSTMVKRAGNKPSAMADTVKVGEVVRDQIRQDASRIANKASSML